MCTTQSVPLPVTAWRKSGGADWMFRNTCGTPDGELGLSADTSRLTDLPFLVSWVWDAPVDLKVASIRSYGNYWTPDWGAGWRADGLGLGAGSAFATDLSGRIWWELKNLNASTVALELSCGWPNQGECESESSASVSFRQIDFVLRDEFLPSVIHSDLSPSNMAEPIFGSLSLGTDFVDRGGGLAGAELLVDGVVTRRVGVGAPSCAMPYTVLVPCPAAGRIGIGFDTTTVSNGEHNVELRLYDVAGNRTAIGPVKAVVRNPLPAGAGPVTPGRVSLQKASVRTSYGAKLRLEGSVAGLDDLPLSGATVEVASRSTAEGAPFTPATPAVTDEAGRFSIPVDPGPSRVYRIRYGASEATAKVLVRAPLKLSVSPSRTRNGRSVRFRGSIAGATALGVRVELQARAGKRWVPFRTAALKQSRFSASYRFTSTMATTRYRFRAVVRADPDLPYTANTSRTVSVLVRP